MKFLVNIMDLLMKINNVGYGNIKKKITMIMVTHNPDLECYADRILYIRDGKLVKQAINECQIPLKLEPYQKYINSVRE